MKVLETNNELETPDKLAPVLLSAIPYGNPALVCPQGEVGLPGAPGLDGEKVILSY